MNFLMAVKHAAIGYGVRRRCWQPNAVLHLDNCGELRWLPKGGFTINAGISREIGGHATNPDDSIARLLGPDKTWDLQPDDITGKDWETI